jgi:hypothetical protein
VQANVSDVAQPFDSRFLPKPGSKITLSPAVTGHAAVEATLVNYLPGKVRGDETRRHRQVVVRVGDVHHKTDTRQIQMVLWKAPARPERKPKEPPAPRRPERRVQNTPHLADLEPGVGWRFDLLEELDAAHEDEHGELHPDLRGLTMAHVDAWVRLDRRRHHAGRGGHTTLTQVGEFLLAEGRVFDGLLE